MPSRALHRLWILLFASALLYGAAASAATVAPPAESSTVAASAVTHEPHLALLLPSDSSAFARAAEAVRAGFLEASRKQKNSALPVRFYPVTDDPQQVLAVYQQAVQSGARFVVGPLTRSGVSALANAPEAIAVPTLALNVPERAPADAPNLYTLSLQVEAEARQAAQLALSEGRRKAFTVTEPTPLAQRTRDAFVEAFERGGGFHIADYAYATDVATLERMRQAAGLGVADMVFFAVDARRLRTVRPYMTALPAYGTSHANPGRNANPTAAPIYDVRFVDMPWIVQPEHPAVMIYERPLQSESDDLDRLYALGIDAYRVAQALLDGRRELDIDGVTGRLTLGADRHVSRGLLVVLMDGSAPVVLGESRP